jgi:hypothetical protein
VEAVMGHYWSEMRGPETDAERDARVADDVARRLRQLPASKFTVDELALLMRMGWSRFQEHYHDDECRRLFKLAKTHNIEFSLKKIDV